jgi:hypothetical protein
MVVPETLALRYHSLCYNDCVRFAVKHVSQGPSTLLGMQCSMCF